jgi:aminocarboxymuconate-semialdehyde decarboxylase
MISFFAGRFASQDERKPWLSRPVLDYFRKFYGDTAVDGWGPALACAHAFLGADHLVFATDYPFGPGGGEPFIQRNLEAVKAMTIPPEEREKILGLNALQLLRLPG